MNGFNPFNHYGQYLPQQYQYPYPQQTQVVKVHGEDGAKAYQIGANSSALLLDESGLIVWLVTSDGAGYRTVSAYDIKPHETAPVPDYGNLEERIAKLEMIVNDNARNTSTVSKKQSDDSKS